VSTPPDVGTGTPKVVFGGPAHGGRGAGGGSGGGGSKNAITPTVGTNRPALIALLNHVRAGDTMVCHSLDRLGRNLTDLRALVTDLTARGVRVEFVKENLAFTGGDSPLQTLLLSMLGSVAEFERALIHERQLEGVALAKAAGRYKGGTPKLSRQRAAQLRERVAAGEPKAAIAREFGITRQTLYNYLAQAEPVPA